MSEAARTAGPQSRALPLVSALAMTLVAGSAAAAEAVGQAYIHGLATWIGADDDRGVKDDVAGGVAGFGYALSEHWNLEGRLMALDLDGKGGAPDQEQTGLSVNFLNLYNRDGLVSPYLLAGIGIVTTDIQGLRDQDDLELSGGIGALTSLGSSRFSLRTEVLYRWQDASDSLGDVLVNVGLTYALGGARAPAPAPAREPAPAAPPAPPPPPADSDGDGVPDRVDECPGTPPGVAVDARGCEIDSDGDGVVDRLDECPGTPAGAEVDAGGCEKELVLRGVNFELDSAALTPESRDILDAVAETLKQRRTYRVEVQGHTDSLGRDQYNRQLSERRAIAVRDYLVARGVPADALTATGYGESQPLVSNDTPDGRSINRRVTLKFSER